MEEIRNKVEAVLFTTGRFLDIEEIARLCELGSIGLIKKKLEDLKEVYGTKETSLQIINHGSKWKLSLKKEYLYLTEKLLTDCELDRPVQETLAVIAYKSPVLQSDVIKIRGNGAYDHIAVLKGYDFVVSEKYGRTRILKVTPKFYDYFDIVEDQLKQKFENEKKE